MATRCEAAGGHSSSGAWVYSFFPSCLPADLLRHDDVLVLRKGALLPTRGPGCDGKIRGLGADCCQWELCRGTPATEPSSSLRRSVRPTNARDAAETEPYLFLSRSCGGAWQNLELRRRWAAGVPRVASFYCVSYFFLTL